MNQQKVTLTEVNDSLMRFKAVLDGQIKLDEKFSQKVVLLLGFEQSAIEAYFQNLYKIQLTFKYHNICIYSISQDIQDVHFIVCPKIHENPDQFMYFEEKLIVENIIKQYPQLKFKVAINYQFYSQLDIVKSISQITGSLLKFGNYQFQQNRIFFLDLNPSCYCYIEKKLEEAKIERFEFKKCTWKVLIKNIMEDNFQPTISIMESQFYGEGTILLNNLQSQVVSKINDKFSEFSKKILRWQQTVFLKSDLPKKKLFKQFLEALKIKVKMQPQDFSKILYSVKEINLVIQEFYQRLAQMLEDIQISQKYHFKQFLKNQQIELKNLKIEPIDLTTGRKDRKLILKLQKKSQIFQVNITNLNFKINIQYKLLEYHLYEIRRVGGLIDQQPVKLKRAVFAIGETRGGKSTLLNILKNPEQLERIPFNQTQNDDLSDDDQDNDDQDNDGSQDDEMDYVIDLKQQYRNLENSMDIGHSEVSKTFKKAYFRYKNIVFIDFPGTQDTRSELNEIALLINIYEQIKATEYPIFLFIINGSNKDKYVQLIKTTFEPILTMLKDRKDFNKINKFFSCLIITKVKERQRKNIIKNWKKLFEGALDLDYSYFKEMFGDDDRCIEFLHANENLVAQNFDQYCQNLQKNVIEMIEETFDQQEKQKITLNLELQINEKLKKYYLDCIPLISDKLEHLLRLVLIQIQEKLLSEQVDVCDLEQSLIELQNITKNNRQNMNIMNMERFLIYIQVWLDSCLISQDSDCMTYLKGVSEDAKWMILLGKYMNHEQRLDGANLNFFLLELEVIIEQIKKSKIQTEVIFRGPLIIIAGLFSAELFVITAIVTAIRLLFPNFTPVQFNRLKLMVYCQNLIFRHNYRKYLNQSQN